MTLHGAHGSLLIGGSCAPRAWLRQPPAATALPLQPRFDRWCCAAACGDRWCCQAPEHYPRVLARTPACRAAAAGRFRALRRLHWRCAAGAGPTPTRPGAHSRTSGLCTRSAGAPLHCVPLPCALAPSPLFRAPPPLAAAPLLCVGRALRGCTVPH